MPRSASPRSPRRPRLNPPPQPVSASLTHRLSCSWPTPMAPPRNAPPRQAASPAARLTGRGAVFIMAGVFLIGLLAAALFGWTVLAGLAFLGGCVVAARYTVPDDLLTVVISPLMLFLGLVVLVSALTEPGSLLLAVVVGSVGTLTGVAPWLAVGMAVTVVITWARGLPRCVRNLIRDLGTTGTARPGTAGPRPSAG